MYNYNTKAFFLKAYVLYLRRLEVLLTNGARSRLCLHAKMNKNMLTLLFLMIYGISAYSFISCETTANKNDNIVVTLVHPDSSVNGKKVVLDIYFYTTDISDHEPRTPLIFEGAFAGNKAVIETNIPVINIDSKNSLRWNLNAYAYLIGDNEDEDIDDHIYNSIPTVFGYYTPNIEQYGNIQNMITQLFPLQKGDNQFFIMEFPKRLNIQADYNLSGYPLKISWDTYPGKVYYNLAILTKDKDGENTSEFEQIGSTGWLKAYYNLYLQNTNVDVSSPYFNFKERYISTGEKEIQIGPSIVPGDILKIEVLVEIEIKIIDRGSLYYQSYMDSITIMYKE